MSKIKKKASPSMHSIKVSKEAHDTAKRMIDVVSSLGWAKLGIQRPGPVTISSLFEAAISKLAKQAEEMQMPRGVGRDDA